MLSQQSDLCLAPTATVALTYSDEKQDGLQRQLQFITDGSVQISLQLTGMTVITTFLSLTDSPGQQNTPVYHSNLEGHTDPNSVYEEADGVVRYAMRQDREDAPLYDRCNDDLSGTLLHMYCL